MFDSTCMGDDHEIVKVYPKWLIIPQMGDDHEIVKVYHKGIHDTYENARWRCLNALQRAIHQISAATNYMDKLKVSDELVQEYAMKREMLQSAKYQLEEMLPSYTYDQLADDEIFGYRQDQVTGMGPENDDQLEPERKHLSREAGTDPENDDEWDPEKDFEQYPKKDGTDPENDDEWDPEKDFEQYPKNDTLSDIELMNENGDEDNIGKDSMTSEKTKQEIKNQWFSGRNVYCVPLRQGRM